MAATVHRSSAVSSMAPTVHRSSAVSSYVTTLGTLPNNWTAKEIFGENSPRKKEPPKPVPKTVKKDEPSEPSKKEEEAKKKKVEKKWVHLRF